MRSTVGVVRRPRPKAAQLRGQGVLLRPWRLEDAELLARAWGDPTIAARLPVPADRTIDAARRWIRAEPSRWNRGLALDWVMVSPRTGDLWGEIGLVPSRARANAAEVGYWVSRAERGRGLARRALVAVASWAFRDGGFDLLAARCDPSNPAAIATAEGAGFRAVESSGDLVVLVTRSPGGTC